MPGDFAISHISPQPALQETAAALGPVSPAAASSDASQASAVSKRPLLNPSLHLDVALNLVVLQFLDDKGDVTDSIPTAKQLKAYQSHQSDGNGPSIPAPKRPAGA